MKKNALKEKHVTDLKIKKLTVRSGVKAAMGCTPCHTPHGPMLGANVLESISLPAIALRLR